MIELDGDTCGIGDHDGFGVIVGEIEAITEEERADKRQVFKLFERDGGLQ